MTMALKVPFDFEPFRLSGVVYGVLLNHRTAVAAMAAQFDAPPYNGPPRAPVLFIKPRNTLSAHGEAVEVPADVEELEVAALMGIVVGRTACRVSEARALNHVAGFLLVNDVSVPHTSYFRPSIRYKARDGFCPLGPRVTPREAVGDPDRLRIRTFVDGVLVQTANTADWVRSVARLIADVTEFMALAPGDVLAAGAAAPIPRVRSGQTVTIDAAGLGELTNRFVSGRA